MAQLTIYLDDRTEEKMARAAREAGLSRSRWVASLIEEKTATEWPEFVRRLAGAWKDFPDAEQIRSDLGIDVPRQKL